MRSWRRWLAHLVTAVVAIGVWSWVHSPSTTSRCYLRDAEGSCKAPIMSDFLIPLWPFYESDAVEGFFQTGGATGPNEWHLDAKKTALRFTREFLDLPDLDVVTSTEVHDDIAYVGVGHHRTPRATVATLLLVKYGTPDDQDSAPWEVVGTNGGDLYVNVPADLPSITERRFTLTGSTNRRTGQIHATMIDTARHKRTAIACCADVDGLTDQWRLPVEAPPYTLGARPIALVVWLSSPSTEHLYLTVRGLAG